MKVVFIQPKSFFTWEALNIGYLAAYINAHEPDIDIEFYTEFYDSLPEIILGCSDADIIGISCTSPQYRRGLELARMIKTEKNKIVLGGFHPSNIYRVPNYIDCLVNGEGEQSILDICQGKNYCMVKSPYLNIDSIPFPDRKIIKLKRNLAEVEKKFGKRIGAILAGRGCPYQCIFCASHSVWGRKIRLRKPESICEEFVQICRDYNLDYVTFADDELGVDKKHLRMLAELLIKHGNKTPWGCNIVAKDMDGETLGIMRAAGCEDLWIGVESGDEKILEQMKKPNTVEDIKKAFAMSKELGFRRRAYCVLGMPDENESTIQATERLLDQIEPDIIGFTILAYYPGTAFYNDEFKNVDWSEVDEYSNNITCTNYFSNEDLKLQQKRLVEKYKNKLTYRNI